MKTRTPTNYVSTLRDKYRILAGTDIYATPGNTFRKYGFDAVVDNEGHFILMYSPIVFCDKAKQSFMEYIKLNPKQREKQLAATVMHRFNLYFRIVTTENHRSIVPLLDAMDELQDKWDKSMVATADIVVRNYFSRHMKDYDACKKLSLLIATATWLSFGFCMCETYLNVHNDPEYDLIEQGVNHIMREIYGCDVRNISDKITDILTNHIKVVFRDIRQVAESKGMIFQ